MAKFRRAVRDYFFEQRLKREKKKLCKPKKSSVLDAMRKHQSQIIPIRERLDYMKRRSFIDYKNITEEEFEMYQSMADS